MALKCVHKGCGKLFSDENEPCTYHPGPPEFHEGQKGWKCCKPRVLTFDEFLTIPPCTTGTHTTVDDSPAPPPTPHSTDDAPVPKPVSTTGTSTSTAGASTPLPPPPTRVPVNRPAANQSSDSNTPAPLAAPDSDSDEPDAVVPPNTTCKRRGCHVSSTQSAGPRDEEKCIYHPGQALFHEGSKGWTCCKRRVLEFDEFMKIEGCKTRPRHCFVGKSKKKGGEGSAGQDLEQVHNVRHDFYQTGTTVHASLFLKKIDKERSKVTFSEGGHEAVFDLITSDGKQYKTTAPLFGTIDPEKSTFRVLGTKLELTLAKADGAGWPVLRSDEKQTGEIIQTGRAGRA